MGQRDIPCAVLACDGADGGVGGLLPNNVESHQYCPHLWVDAEDIKAVDLTVVVFDRFNGRLVEGESGVMDELAPTEPIRAPAVRAVPCGAKTLCERCKRRP